MAFFYRTISGNWIVGIPHEEIKERKFILSNEREFDSSESDD